MAVAVGAVSSGKHRDVSRRRRLVRRTGQPDLPRGGLAGSSAFGVRRSPFRRVYNGLSPERKELAWGSYGGFGGQVLAGRRVRRNSKSGFGVRRRGHVLILIPDDPPSTLEEPCRTSVT